MAVQPTLPGNKANSVRDYESLILSTFNTLKKSEKEKQKLLLLAEYGDLEPVECERPLKEKHRKKQIIKKFCSKVKYGAKRNLYNGTHLCKKKKKKL
jgi:hypothetical protein